MARKREQGLTVDGDSKALGESEAILAEESGNLSERAGLGVLDARRRGVGLNNVELEVVGLRNCLDGSGAGVL